MKRIVTLAAAAIALAVIPGAGGGDPPATQPADASTSPMSLNAGCYVCHIPFVKESLSKDHLAHGVSCAKCHGTSDKHANDEDIGATKPDIVFKRDQINAACRKCHEKHDVAPEKIVARLAERGMPKPPAVCTDCHGNHRIDKP